MKKLNYIWVLILVISLIGCRDDPTNPETEEASAQKQFVWNAMNFWYYWQDDVTELGDNYFDDDEAFNGYLNGFSDAENVFYSLLHQEDDFSFFINNYEEFNQSQQGISQSFGYEFGLVCQDNDCSTGSDRIFGYVQYVYDDAEDDSPGPAKAAGLQRGNIFTSVDGTRLNAGNYRELLQGKSSYTLTLAEIANGQITETDKTVSLQAETMTEDPIFTSAVFDTNATKVGYLLYNSFQLNSHQNLNKEFQDFLSEGVDELIVDLRYNGGGPAITSQILGSLIAGRDSSNVFAECAYSQKRSDLNSTVSFVEELPIYNEEEERAGEEPLNTLSLDKVYILTGFGTASASEVLINGLDPYIDVVLVGRQTVGKDEGSYTLYDTPSPPYMDEKNANPDHKIAIQPIAIKVVNKNGREYPDGFIPEYEVNEIGSLEGGLPPLGDPSDPLLGKALELITGQAAKARISSGKDFGQMFKDSKDLQPYEKGLYIKPDKSAVPNF